MTAKIPIPSDHPNLIPTEDEFAAWCQNPVTRWVALSHKNMADLAKATWIQASWDSGVADPTRLAVLKAKAETFRAFYHADWRDHLANVNHDVWDEVDRGYMNGALEKIDPPKERHRG